MDRSKRSPVAPVAIIAGGLVLAALIGCEREQSVASKSAAAFREAQKRGETFGGDGHAHGHGAVTPGGENGAPEGMPSGHEHTGAEVPSNEAMRHGGAHRGMAHPGAAGEGKGGSHAAMAHGGHAAAPSGPTPRRPEGAAQAGPHAGHTMPGQPSPATPPAGSGHAGHAPAPAGMPAAPPVPAPGPVPPGQPAATLRPDALDAPAATSVIEAQRAAEMAREMAGGHGAHGAGTYRQIDAGREPAAQPERQEEKEHVHEPPDAGGSGGPAADERRRA